MKMSKIGDFRLKRLDNDPDIVYNMSMSKTPSNRILPFPILILPTTREEGCLIAAGRLVVTSDQYDRQLETMKSRAAEYAQKFDTTVWIEFYKLNQDGTMCLIEDDAGDSLEKLLSVSED